MFENAWINKLKTSPLYVNLEDKGGSADGRVSMGPNNQTGHGVGNILGYVPRDIDVRSEWRKAGAKSRLT